MESKQLHTERHLFGQNYHLNINLQLSLKNLKWKLRNGYVIHVPADYAKNLNQILGLLTRNMVSKNVNLLCFTTFSLKNFKNDITLQKNYVIATVQILLRIFVPDVKQFWLADDSIGAGSLKSLKNWWTNIISEDGCFDYHVNDMIYI